MTADIKTPKPIFSCDTYIRRTCSKISQESLLLYRILSGVFQSGYFNSSLEVFRPSPDTPRLYV